MAVQDEDPGDEHQPSNGISFDYKTAESAQSASVHPAISSPTTTTLPATHPAIFPATTTPPKVEGLGFTGIPYPTYGVTRAATTPPMATAVAEPVASSSAYSGICESLPRCYDDDYHRPRTGVYMTGIPGFAVPETGYTMQAPGFTSLSELSAPESCGGRSRGSGRSSDKSPTRLKIRKALQGATANLVGDLTQEIRAKLQPLIPPQGSPTTMGASPHRLQAKVSSWVMSGLGLPPKGGYTLGLWLTHPRP